MSIQKAEMSVEQIENGQIVEQVVYPFVEYDHVTMENGMDIMSMIRDDVSTPTVTHDATSWRVGQGDGDVSKSIVDSSVAIMTIKGQTYQNILPSPSLRNSMTNGKTMQKLNEGYDSVNTVDGVCKSAILKGQTLVNLATPIEFKSITYHGYCLIINGGMLKSGTYTLKSSVDFSQYVVNLMSTQKDKPSQYRRISIAKNGVFTIDDTFFVANGVTTEDFFICLRPVDNPSGGTVTTNEIENAEFILLEGDYTNTDIPYFEGMQSVKMPVLTTTGKNLFNYFDLVAGKIIWDTSNNVNIFEDGWYQESADGVGFALRKCIKVKPNTRYYVNFPQSMHFMQYKVNGDLIKGKYPTTSTGYVTTSSETHYVNLFPSGGISSAWNEARRQEYQNCYISESEVMSSYEPYKTNILSTPEDLVLRGIGEARDELNLLTGEKISKLEQLTVTNNTNWLTQTSSHSDCYSFYYNPQIGKSDGLLICDNLPSINRLSIGEGCRITGTGRININILKSKLNDSSLNSLNDYLAINPLTFIYELPNASIKTVDLSILDQDNQPTTQLNSFANGYIQVSSQGLIPSVDYEVPTSNSYHVDLMKPNTQYTMKNMQGTFTIDNIQYNASTNGTFTSPSALTNNFMITSVAQSQPMLLEGDVREKDIPYFKGIKSAFEDESKIEVLSTGKNLYSHGDSAFTPERDGWYFINGDRETLFGDKVHKDCGQGAWFYLEGGRYYFNVVGNDNVKTLQVVGEKERLYGSGATIPKGWYALRMRVQNANQEVSITNVMVEKDTETNYEPYKSNSTKIPLLSPLRSLPNGVYDELIIDRMKKKATLIQRIKSTVFNGSEDWNLNNYSHDKLIEFVCHSGAQMAHTVFSDRFITGGENVERVAFSGGSIYIRILKTKVSNVDSFKKWLSQNPLTVQYGLQTPLITEVNLEGYPYVYKGGHIFLNTEIAPTTEVTYSINQAHQIESSNEDILRHQNEINHLYQLIAQYVQVQYEAELIDIALQG